MARVKALKSRRWRSLGLRLGALPLATLSGRAEALPIDMQSCTSGTGGSWGDGIVCAFQQALSAVDVSGIIQKLGGVFLVIIAYRLIQILMRESPEKWVSAFIDLGWKIALTYGITFAGSPMRSYTWSAYLAIERAASSFVSDSGESFTTSSGFDVILQEYKKIWDTYTSFATSPTKSNDLGNAACNPLTIDKYFSRSPSQADEIPDVAVGNCILQSLDELANSKDDNAVKKIETARELFLSQGIGGLTRERADAMLAATSAGGGFSVSAGASPLTAAQKIKLWAFLKQYEKVGSQFPISLEIAELNRIERGGSSLNPVVAVEKLTAWVKLTGYQMGRAFSNVSSALYVFTPIGIIDEGPLLLGMLVLVISLAGSALLIGYAFFMMVFVPTLVVPLGIAVYNMAWITSPLEGQTRKLIDVAKTVLLPFAIAPAVFVFFSKFVVAVLSALSAAVGQVSGNFPISIILIVVAFLVAVTSFWAFKLLMRVRDLTRDFISTNFTPLLDFAMDIANFGKDIIASAIKVAAVGALGGAVIAKGASIFGGAFTRPGGGGGLMASMAGRRGPGGGGGGGMPPADGGGDGGGDDDGGGGGWGSFGRPGPARGGGTVGTLAEALSQTSSVSPREQAGAMLSVIEGGAGGSAAQAAPVAQTALPMAKSAEGIEARVAAVAETRARYDEMGGDEALAGLRARENAIRGEYAKIQGELRAAESEGGAGGANVAEIRKRLVAKDAELSDPVAGVRPQIELLEGAKGAADGALSKLASQRGFLVEVIREGVAAAAAAAGQNRPQPSAVEAGSALPPRSLAATAGPARGEGRRAAGPLPAPVAGGDDAESPDTPTFDQPAARGDEEKIARAVAAALGPTLAAIGEALSRLQPAAAAASTVPPGYGTAATATRTAQAVDVTPRDGAVVGGAGAMPGAGETGGGEDLRARQERLAAQKAALEDAVRAKRESSVTSRIRAFYEEQPEWVRSGIGSIFSDLRGESARALKMTSGGSDGSGLLGELGRVGGAAAGAAGGAREAFAERFEADRRSLRETEAQLAEVEKEIARRRNEDASGITRAVNQSLSTEAARGLLRSDEAMAETVSASRGRRENVQTAVNNASATDYQSTVAKSNDGIALLKKESAEMSARAKELKAAIGEARDLAERRAAEATYQNFGPRYIDQARALGREAREEEAILNAASKKAAARGMGGTEGDANTGANIPGSTPGQMNTGDVVKRKKSKVSLRRKR